MMGEVKGAKKMTAGKRQNALEKAATEWIDPA